VTYEKSEAFNAGKLAWDVASVADEEAYELLVLSSFCRDSSTFKSGWLGLRFTAGGRLRRRPKKHYLKNSP
jgi:hypothetical protein